MLGSYDYRLPMNGQPVFTIRYPKKTTEDATLSDRVVQSDFNNICRGKPPLASVFGQQQQSTV
jgi:hypothetical protein